MPDIVNKEIRSRMMAGIRSKDTQPELLVRRFLHGRGFRFRLHAANVPGRPDIVLPKYRAVVFVHGCFWHRHPGCRYAYEPKSRADFWKAKFARNIERDREVRQVLLDAGWRVMVVWECGLRNQSVRERGLDTVADWILSDWAVGEYP